MLSLARRVVPRSIKRFIAKRLERRRAKRLFGPLADLVPPVEDMFDGPGSLEEFKSNGEEFLRIYRTIGGLTPDDRVLDVGSGIGRKTLPLLGYLSPAARYEGMDVNRFGVDWCRTKITPRNPAFQFRWIDVRNRLYHPHGTSAAGDFRFPYEDRSFTFVTVESVFTHMVPAEIGHYLSEIARVLGSGRCIASFFLLNEESRRLIASGASTQAFLEARDGWATVSRETPEAAIAVDETLVNALYAEAGLEIVSRHPGSWCGRREFLSYQDLLVAVKR